MKIITVCGSLKFQQEMMRAAETLSLQGNCVLSVVYPASPQKIYTQAEKEILGAMHKERIKLSDAVYIVNVEGYIGEQTKSEIAFAKALGKEILYLCAQ